MELHFGNHIYKIDSMVSGSLLINKQVGLTSRQEVNNVSRALKEKKAGHIGTLDPFADGLLIVNLGKSTKIAPFLEVMDKKYIATLKLGEKTDTGDLTGNLIEKKEKSPVKPQYVEEILRKFIGEQVQIPPMYSAIKVDGKELYKYAREGKEIERKERKINIFELKLLTLEDDTITFYAHVSKGTYIRTLGEDIAEKLGTVGHLTKLTRIAIGPYSLENAVTCDEVGEKDLIPVLKMLEHMPSFEVDDELKKKAENGMHFRLPIQDETVLLKSKEEAIAVYKREPSGVYSCVRGLR